MTRLRFIAFILGVSCAIVACTCALGAEMPKGRLLETVACAADNTQTYALYLPTTFDSAHRWPVVFCFDPGARGRIPVERFIAAAEKHGYIIAGSNNSRNGPWEANATAINAMIKDVDRFLPLDPNRIYVAGLSGGARVAGQVALSGIAKGVIACGAGFLGAETPSRVKFPFFGTTGITDFNYLELRRIDRDLEERHTPHRVVIHSGGHEWLSAELATAALAWLDLQAVRTGAKPKDPAWIEANFSERRTHLPAEPLTVRQRELRSLIADFKGLTAVGDVEKELAELTATREFRDAAKAERSAESREESLTADLFAAVRDEFKSGVKKTAAELRAKSASTDTPDGQMAARVLQAVYSNCIETSRELLRQESYAEAQTVLEMVTLMRPDRPQPYFDLARCFAHRGDRKRALTTLQQAAGAGFRDAARIESEKIFEPLRTEPAFLELLSAMR